MQAKLMGRFVDFQPAFSIYFIGTDLFTDFGVEDLRATTGYAIESGRHQSFQSIFYTHFCFAEHVIVFDGGESFDVQIGPMGFYGV